MAIEFSITELTALLEAVLHLRDQMTIVQDQGEVVRQNLTSRRQQLVSVATAIAYSDADMTGVVTRLTQANTTLASLVAQMTADIAIVDAKVAEISG